MKKRKEIYLLSLFQGGHQFLVHHLVPKNIKSLACFYVNLLCIFFYSE